MTEAYRPNGIVEAFREWRRMSRAWAAAGRPPGGEPFVRASPSVPAADGSCARSARWTSTRCDGGRFGAQ